MVTKKIVSPAAIAPTVPATPTEAPAKLPARKRAIAAKPAVKKAPPQQATPSTQPEKTASVPAPVPALAETMPLPEKPKKIKMVRDSFTMPKAEYAVLDELKQRAFLLGRPLKKSELLRAGVKLLAALPDARLLAVLPEASLPQEQPANTDK
jgi:hypothetical protein